VRKEIFISVDIEASGPVPGAYSMLALGACVVANCQEQFYVELRPISAASVPAALKVVGRSLEEFQRVGQEPAEAMARFRDWVGRVSDKGKPVFVGFNAPFDWAFVNWYFHTFQEENPFGIGALDIKSFYMGMSGCSWKNTRSSRLPAKYRADKPHTHNALSDAIEQAEMFEVMARDAGVMK
jgi:ribonuclease T